jgi:proteasome lid subunit RPN8/RPN11
MSRPNVSRTGTDYSGIPSESEVTDSVADEDCEEDISVVVHSEQHSECQLGSPEVRHSKVMDGGEGEWNGDRRAGL